MRPSPVSRFVAFAREVGRRLGFGAGEPDRRTERRRLGDAGEAFAEAYFRTAGYTVLARNWRSGRDELDLVLLAPGGELPVFVEVKTRREGDPKGGYHAVDARKRIALRRAVRAYLRTVGSRDAAFRFDIAEVRVAEGPPWARLGLRVIHHCAVPLFSK